MTDVCAINTSHFVFKEFGTALSYFIYILFNLGIIYWESTLYREYAGKDEQEWPLDFTKVIKLLKQQPWPVWLSG